MRRIVIMGPPGSGKSTLARHLGSKYRLPVFHLDQAYWQPGWVETPPDVFRAEVERLAALPEWIIDGNYTATIAPRFAAADVVIYLDTTSWRSLLRVTRRLLLGYGRVRPDASPGCPERLDLAFLRFVWSWNRESRTRTLTLIKGFEGRRLILKGRVAAEDILNG